nr:alpha/beta hydrolase [Rhodanobacter glycinis]
MPFPNCEQVLDSHPPRQMTTREGVVSYREAGTGTPVILLHGISSGAASWAPQLAGLATTDLRVIAWDAPGYGASAALGTQAPSAADYARVLGAWVDALGLARFTLVGHSLGALMATAYASANPERLNHLVLLSPARGYAEASVEEREERFRLRMDMLDRLGPEGLARERAAALLSPQAPAEAVAWVASNMRRLQPAGYCQAARMLVDDDLGRYARDCNMPVAVICGDADHITPTEKCRVIASQFPAATFEVVPALGHALYIEDPAHINSLLRGHIAA